MQWPLYTIKSSHTPTPMSCHRKAFNSCKRTCPTVSMRRSPCSLPGSLNHLILFTTHRLESAPSCMEVTARDCIPVAASSRPVPETSRRHRAVCGLEEAATIWYCKLPWFSSPDIGNENGVKMLAHRSPGYTALNQLGYSFQRSYTIGQCNPTSSSDFGDFP